MRGPVDHSTCGDTGARALYRYERARCFLGPVRCPMRHQYGGHLERPVVERGEIIGLVLSCRVLGLDAERTFLQHIVDVLKADCSALTGRIHETSRNIPVRNVYRDSGFVLDSNGLWR